MIDKQAVPSQDFHAGVLFVLMTSLGNNIHLKRQHFFFYIFEKHGWLFFAFLHYLKTETGLALLK